MIIHQRIWIAHLTVRNGVRNGRAEIGFESLGHGIRILNSRFYALWMDVPFPKFPAPAASTYAGLGHVLRRLVAILRPFVHACAMTDARHTEFVREMDKAKKAKARSKPDVILLPRPGTYRLADVLRDRERAQPIEETKP
jgi:hypothetical protein